VITVINDQHSCPLGEDGHVLLGVKESSTGQRHVLLVKESLKSPTLDTRHVLLGVKESCTTSSQVMVVRDQHSCCPLGQDGHVSCAVMFSVPHCSVRCQMCK